MNMNTLMLNGCQNLNTKHAHSHKQIGPPPHTHSSMDSFINNMSQSGCFLFFSYYIFFFYCCYSSAHPRPWTRLSQSRLQEGGRWTQATVFNGWPEMGHGQIDQGLCFSLVIGSVLDLNAFNRCTPEPWAMEQPTVEECALCAAVSLFSAALVPASLLDSVAVCTTCFISTSCKLEQDKTCLAS